MDLIEIKEQSDIELYVYYVLRDDILYKTKNLNDIKIDEEYCHVFTTPATPPEVVLLVEKKTNDYLKIFNSYVRDVINSEYFTMDGIKNYLLNNDKFKDSWE